MRNIFALFCVVAAIAATVTYGALGGVASLLMLPSAFVFATRGNLYALGSSYIDISSNTTGDTLGAMDPAGVRQLWQEGCDIFEQTADFWTPLEGGKDAVVETITDTSKGVGQKINFTTRAGFYDEPHMGEELFLAQDDFEQRLIANDSVTVDFIRHATRSTERMEEIMGMRDEIRNHDNEDLGDWLGRWKSEALFMTCLNKIPETNILYVNSKSQDTLASSDTIDWSEIVGIGAIQQRLGGLPALLGENKNGIPLYRNLFVATGDSLIGLENDPVYRNALTNTRDEAAAKMFFDGGYTDVRGHVVKKFQPIDHDGEGAIGSPLNPKANLGVAISAGTAAFAIYGGGNPTSAAKTKKAYFKYFPGFAYRFSYADTLAVDSGTKYLVIINPPNAAVDPNKWGLYSYTTGNNGNNITITGRLASYNGGVCATTLGSATWNASVNTMSHPVGALIMPANAKGTVYGSALMLGRRALRRAYGKYRNKRSQQVHNGDFVLDRFITTVLGQAPRVDRLGRVPGVFVLKHAIPYPGIPVPTTA